MGPSMAIKRGERRDRGAGVCEQRNRGVSAREPLSHDSGADDRGRQQQRAEKFREPARVA